MQNAWPGQKTLQLDGWQVRLSNGLTRRANSVQTLFSGNLDLIHKINICEKLYHSQNLTSYFKISPLSTPTDLDLVLADKGYAKEALTQIMVGKINLSIRPVANVHLNLQTDSLWLQTFCEARYWDPGMIPHIESIFANIPTLFACAHISAPETGAPHACMALAVLQEEYVHLLHLYTRPDMRLKGYARQISQALMFWAAQAGCTRLLLSVEKHNQPAIELYQQLGMQQVYDYWYRSQKIG